MSGLNASRERLDEIDEQVAALLGERFEVCRAIAEHKRVHGIPMMQPDRVRVVRERYLSKGAEVGLPAEFIESFFELLIAATCAMEDDLIAAGSAPAGNEQA